MLASIQLTTLLSRSVWAKHWLNAVKASQPILFPTSLRSTSIRGTPSSSRNRTQLSIRSKVSRTLVIPFRDIHVHGSHLFQAEHRPAHTKGRIDHQEHCQLDESQEGGASRPRHHNKLREGLVRRRRRVRVVRSPHHTYEGSSWCEQVQTGEGSRASRSTTSNWRSCAGPTTSLAYNSVGTTAGPYTIVGYRLYSVGGRLPPPPTRCSIPPSTGRSHGCGRCCARPARGSGSVRWARGPRGLGREGSAGPRSIGSRCAGHPTVPTIADRARVFEGMIDFAAWAVA